MLLTHGLNKDKVYYHFADINSGVSGSVITFSCLIMIFSVDMVELLVILVTKIWITHYLEHIKF